MLEFIGFIGILVFCVWLTLLVFFGTVSTFGEALFSKSLPYKVLGVILWIAIVYIWYNVVSSVNITIT